MLDQVARDAVVLAVQVEPNGGSDWKEKAATEETLPPLQEAEGDKPKRKGWWTRLSG